MSLKISNSLHTNCAVIHRPDLLSKHVKQNQSLAPGRSLNKIIVIPRQLILPAHIQKDMGAQMDEMATEEIEHLISKLDLIASEKLDSGIGFRPQQRDKLDIKLGYIAGELSRALIEKPDQEKIQDAKRFIKRVKLIDDLEEIRRKRHLSAIGLRLDEAKERNIKYGDKAYDLARNLKASATRENIKAAMEFISIDEIIETLEDIAQEKGRTNIGLIIKPQKEEDEVLEKLTQGLADILKEKPDENTMQAAVKLINLVLLADSLKDSNNVEVLKEPRCYGLHCSLDKYTTAA